MYTCAKLCHRLSPLYAIQLLHMIGGSDGEAKSLAEAGFSALWLPPATKGTFGDQGVGYAVYDTYDLGEVLCTSSLNFKKTSLFK